MIYEILLIITGILIGILITYTLMANYINKKAKENNWLINKVKKYEYRKTF